MLVRRHTVATHHAAGPLQTRTLVEEAMDLSHHWNSVREALAEDIGAQDLKIWFRGVYPVRLVDQTITLAVPSDINKQWITENYASHLQRHWARALGMPVNFEFTIASAPQPDAEPARHSPPPIPTPDSSAPPDRSRSNVGVNPWQRFDNYVVGECNRFAHAAAEAVAEHPATTYNPLFIYGETGVGKTHLMQAIGNKIADSDPTARIIYITAEDFVNRVVDGIRHKQMDRIRAEFRAEATVLLVDDIQFISGRERTQEEFFHTFNHLQTAGRQVVLTSDAQPADIKGLEPRLRTRFEGGLLADIQPPDRETRLAILAEEAEARKLLIPPDLSEAIVQHARGSLREIKGLVNNLAAMRRIYDAPLTLAFAKEHLPRIFTHDSPVISVANIIESVARVHNLHGADITGNGRTRTLTTPRHIAMYLARTHTSQSYPELGKAFGGRDHTTIRHGYMTVKKKLKENADLEYQVRLIEKSLGLRQ